MELLALAFALFVAGCGDSEIDREGIDVDLENLRSTVLEKGDDAQILAEGIGAPAAPVLIELLESKDAEVRDIALSCLVLTGYDETALILARSLSDKDESVRIRALQSLRSRYDNSILRELTNNLTNQDSVVRGGVARLIGLIGDATAVKPLRKRLEDETDLQAGKQIKVALARLGDDDLKEEFASLLESGTAEGGRYRTIRDFEYINDPKLAKRLLPALIDTGDAYEIGHPAESPRFARVCDAAITLIGKWYDKPFSFETDDLNTYSDEEIGEAQRFIESLE
jgi:HEAT repeat protein